MFYRYVHPNILLRSIFNHHHYCHFYNWQVNSFLEKVIIPSLILEDVAQTSLVQAYTYRGDVESQA